MTLDQWLSIATKGLSHESIAKVRSEIWQHGDDALAAGQDPIAALGDPAIANRAYRKVLLTAGEARILGRQCRKVSSPEPKRPIAWILLTIPVLLLDAGILTALYGLLPVARLCFGMALVLGPILISPYLPIYTPVRSRWFRAAKWICFLAGIASLGPKPSFWFTSGLGFLWLAYLDVLQMRIRSKLPPAQWPKQLYL